jgi:two-component system, cell cycle response regulator
MMHASSTRGQGERWWLLYLATGYALVGLYYLIPREGSMLVVRVVVYCAISASAAVAVLATVALRPVGPRLPWVLLGLSQVVYAMADTTFYVLHYLLHNAAYPGPADVLYLAHYPLVVAGLTLLIRRRSPGKDRPSLIDAAVLAVVAAMLSWLFLIGPQAALDAPLPVKAASLAYPVADLAMLAVALRLVMAAGRRPTSFFLLCGYLFAIFAADTLYALQQLHSTYQTGNFLDAIWLAGNLALGAAALHPTRVFVAEQGRNRDQPLGPARLLALTAAALVAPATLLVQYLRGHSSGIPVVAVACAVLFVLTIARLAGVVAVQRRLAITDALTGLHTRRFLEATLPLELARARRGGGAAPAIFILDVDHFKSINDRYGHPAGDRALVEIANRLRAAARDGDVLARHGGEEFAVLVPSAHPQELVSIAERLRQRIASSPFALVDDRWIAITVSVGAACYPVHGGTPSELVSAADRALYLAKAHGRNRVMVAGAPGASVGYIPPSLDRTAMVDYLRHVADRVDGLLSGYEHSQAISRWTVLLAQEFGLDETTRRCTELAGRLHDIGKIIVPEAVLTKPGELSEEEWVEIRRHPEYGYRMARLVPGLDTVATIIRQHHERYDGLGYPDRLAGPSILFGARILAVCDAWAAMLADRPYQRMSSEEQARDALVRGRGGQFDPEVVDVFLEVHERGVLGLPGRLPGGQGAMRVHRPPRPGADPDGPGGGPAGRGVPGGPAGGGWDSGPWGGGLSGSPPGGSGDGSWAAADHPWDHGPAANGASGNGASGNGTAAYGAGNGSHGPAGAGSDDVAEEDAAPMPVSRLLSGLAARNRALQLPANLLPRQRAARGPQPSDQDGPAPW